MSAQSEISLTPAARPRRTGKAYMVAFGLVFVMEVVLALIVSPTGGRILEHLGMAKEVAIAGGAPGL